MNNPSRYIDPTGHAVYEGDDGGLTVTGYTYVVEKKYNWKIKGKWSLEEVKTIYQTGRDIETYVDGLTDGKGLARINKYLGGVSISHGSDGRASSSWPWKHIYLGKTWLSGYAGGASWTPLQLLAHEFGHRWDMYLGIGGGVGDDLTWLFWSDPRTSLRFKRTEPVDPIIPSKALWDTSVNYGYGNGSINDYVAEAFSWSIYNPHSLPFGSNGIVAMVVNQTIKQQADTIP